MDPQRGADFNERPLLRRGLDFLRACWHLPATLRNSCPRRGLSSSAPTEPTSALLPPPSVEASNTVDDNPPPPEAEPRVQRLFLHGGENYKRTGLLGEPAPGWTWNSIQPDLEFDPARRNYSRTPWGDPVPQVEWERRAWRI
eukprot:3741750-Amphidinium_carterae.1